MSLASLLNTALVAAEAQMRYEEAQANLVQFAQQMKEQDPVVSIAVRKLNSVLNPRKYYERKPREPICKFKR